MNWRQANIKERPFNKSARRPMRAFKRVAIYTGVGLVTPASGASRSDKNTGVTVAQYPRYLVRSDWMTEVSRHTGYAAAKDRTDPSWLTPPYVGLEQTSLSSP